MRIFTISGLCTVQASALRHCKNEALIAPQVVQIEPDPIATSAVYVTAPCNDTAVASAAVAGGDAAALSSEVKELRKQVARKDEVLRVRNNQLAEISKLLDERESLWNASLARAPLHNITMPSSSPSQLL